MTKEQIAAVLDRVRTWSDARQEDAVRVLLAMEAQEITPYALDAEERAEIKAVLDEVARGEFATEAEVEAVFARYRA
jgi:hypothetical protein